MSPLSIGANGAIRIVMYLNNHAIKRTNIASGFYFLPDE